MLSSSVVAVLCLLAGTNNVLAADPFPDTVESMAVFFEDLFSLTSTSVGLYSFEQSCSGYAVGGKSSTFKAIYLVNYTQTCTADSNQMTVTERPLNMDTSSSFVDFIVQYINQMCIIKKEAVYTKTKECNGPKKPSKECKKTDTTNVYMNIQYSMEYFFSCFSISITSGTGLQLFTELQSACSGSGNASAVTATLTKIVKYCYCLGEYQTTTTSPATTTVPQTTTPEAVPTTAAPHDSFTVCYQFSLFVFELMVDIKCQWQMELWLIEFELTHPGCTQEEKLNFFIEMIIQLQACKENPSFQWPTEKPQVDSGKCYWGEYIVQLQMECVVELNIELITKCGEALITCGKNDIEVPSSRPQSSWEMISFCYEAYFLKMNISITEQVLIDLKVIINNVKLTVEYKKQCIVELCIKIFCFLYPEMGCGPHTIAPFTEGFTVESTDSGFTDGVTGEFTDSVTEIATESYTASSDEYAVSDTTSGSVIDKETCENFEGLLEFIFGECGCKEYFEIVFEKQQSCGCCWYCEEGKTEVDYENVECDSEFDMFIELQNPSFKDFLMKTNFSMTFQAEVKVCKFESKPKNCLYAITNKYKKKAKEEHGKCGCEN